MQQLLCVYPVTAKIVVYVQLLQQLLCVSCYCKSYSVCPVPAKVIVCVRLLQKLLCMYSY